MRRKWVLYFFRGLELLALLDAPVVKPLDNHSLTLSCHYCREKELRWKTWKDPFTLTFCACVPGWSHTAQPAKRFVSLRLWGDKKIRGVGRGGKKTDSSCSRRWDLPGVNRSMPTGWEVGQACNDGGSTTWYFSGDRTLQGWSKVIELNVQTQIQSINPGAVYWKFQKGSAFFNLISARQFLCSWCN